MLMDRCMCPLFFSSGVIFLKVTRTASSSQHAFLFAIYGTGRIPLAKTFIRLSLFGTLTAPASIRRQTEKTHFLVGLTSGLMLLPTYIAHEHQ